MNEKAIDDALELGISSCLQSLQISNPSLLLDANQLKKTERDVRYIPSVAAALTSMVLNCEDVEAKQNMMSMIKSWRSDTASHDHFPIVSQDVHDLDNHSIQSGNTLDSINDKEHIMKLEASIVSKFSEVMNIIKARKIEETKKTKAEYLRRRKKVARCSNDSDESSSVEDLDDFLSVHSSEHDKGSDEESSNDDNATKVHTINNTEDFDDNDEWW